MTNKGYGIFFFGGGEWGEGGERCIMGDVQVEYKQPNFLTHGAPLRARGR